MALLELCLSLMSLIGVIVHFQQKQKQNSPPEINQTCESVVYWLLQMEEYAVWVCEPENGLGKSV